MGIKSVSFRVQRLASQRGSRALSRVELEYLIDGYNKTHPDETARLSFRKKKVKPDEPVEQASKGGEGGSDAAKTPVAAREADPKADVQD
jgi:hypothetical protein